MIRCRDVSKTYQRRHALENISLQIEPNKITGIIGRNGAGKTTLLKTIAGYFRPTSGEVTIYGKEPFDNRHIATNLVFVDDAMAFPDTLSIGEILKIPASFYPNWDAPFARKLFDYFKLDERQRHEQLSKGKKSTFNMIIGLAARPAITIFDEPITGMDASVRKDFYRALLKDYIAHPRTIIISSHHLEEMEELLEDVILIDEGRIVFHFPIDEMKQYAIGVTGSRSEMVQWLKDKEVLFEEQVGMDDMYAVIRNDAAVEEINQSRFRVTSVPLSDVAMYVTKEREGGIDDVFAN